MEAVKKSGEFRLLDRLGNPIPIGDEEFFLVKRDFAPAPQDAWGLKEKAELAAWPRESQLWFELECRQKRENRAAALRREAEKVTAGVTLQFGYSLPALELRSNMQQIREEQRIERESAWLSQALPAGARIRICGILCPRIGKSWKAYMRKQGESNRAWKRRVAGMVAAKDFGRKVREEERRQDLSPFHQLVGIMRDADNFVDKWVLGEEWLQRPNKKDLEYVASLRQPATRRRPVYYGPKNHKNYWYIESRLALKKRRALYQDEWREARCLRKEKMERAGWYTKDHKFVSLKSALLQTVTDFVRGYKEQHKNWPVPPPTHTRGKPVGQMEAEGASPQGDPEAKQEKTSTVVLQHQAGDSIGNSLPETSPSMSYREMAACNSEVSAEELCDRWFTLTQFEWSSTQTRDSSIPELDLELPKDIIDNESFKKSPNYIPFSRHMYWRGDIELELVCNANVRMFGQLQLSFYYGDTQDAMYQKRLSIWSASQRLHSLLTGNTSNNVRLKIPFEYIFPTMAINRASGPGYRTLGRLQCRVIVPLTVVSTSSNSCECTLLIRFTNNSFQGMVGRVIAEGQMFPLASIIAVKSLLDNNRDRPTMTAPGMPMIPVNCSSWCAGTGQADYANILRLDPTKVLPYEEGRVPTIDEMKIDFIKNIFGMFRIDNWSAQQKKGTKLLSFNAVPLDAFDQYPETISKLQECYAVPPVGVLTSLFSYWRGSLEYRVDIVGCTEITGRILIAYIPRVNKDFKLTIQDAYGCAHAIFDIRENRQISFKIPFVASQMFWPRRSTVSPDYPTYEGPGAIFVFVYNSLVVNSTIPDNCFLVSYIRGGSDFELAVPASPSSALCFNNTVLVPPTVLNRIVPVEGYVPMYVSSWHTAYFDASICNDAEWAVLTSTWGKTIIYKQKLFIPVFRYGAVSDHITQLRYIGNWTSYIGQFVTPFINSTWKMLNYVGNTTTVATINSTKYIAISKKTESYKYALPIPDEKSAQNYIACMSVCEEHFKDKSNFQHMIISWCAMYSQYIKYWPTLTSDLKGYCITPDTSDWFNPDSWYAIPWPTQAVGQMDEREKLAAPPAAPQCSAVQSMASRLVFGEQFLDLKDYCRRYQLYATGFRKFDKSKTASAFRNILLKFPVLPQGLILDIGNKASIREYWNRSRDGPIPIIASGFRFFTGGIRFRICLNITSKDENADREPAGKLFVQHRPNIVQKNRQVSIIDFYDFNSDDIELPGYAAYHQFENINNVLSIEVPFYVPSIRTYLQQLSDTDLATRFGSLGELVIGVTTYNNMQFNLNWDIYYCLADDARFSVFVGFPPIFDITQLPAVNPSVSQQNELVLSKPKPIDNEVPNLRDSTSSEHSDLDDIDLDAVEKARLLEMDIPYNKEKSRYEFDDSKGIRYYVSSVKISKMGKSGFVDFLWKMKRPMPVGQMGWLNFGKTAETVEKVNTIMDGVDSEEVKESINNLTKMSKSFKENLLDFIPSLESIEIKMHKYIDIIINCVTNLCHVILNFNLKAIGIAVASIFAQLKLFSYSMIGSITDRLTRVFSFLAKNKDVDLLQQNIEAAAPAIVGQMADSEPQKEQDGIICAYISSLIAGVAGFFSFSYKFCNEKRKHLSELVFDGIGKFAFTANHLFTFVKNNLLVIKRIAEWFFSSHPSQKKLEFLKNQDESIHTWALHVAEVTDPRRENLVFQNAREASKVYVLAQQAALLQIKMLEMDLQGTQVQTLNLLVKKICDLRDRLAKAHLAPPIRFEPFVYELTGDSGIGKSELSKVIPYKLFNLLGLTHNGPLIYHRNLGNSYWNNLRNEPVCSIDDKFPVKTPEFLGAQLAELFQLKSSCVFNPPMAAVEDKHIKYNPLIVQYLSNHAFLDLPEIINKIAVSRRRDMLVHVRIKPVIVSKYNTKGTLQFNQLRKEDIGRADMFDYLEFGIYDDVRYPQDIETLDWVNYEEFLGRITSAFKDFYKKEEMKFRRDILMIRSVLPKEGEPSSFDELFNYRWIDSFQDNTDHVDKEDLSLIRKLQNLNETHIYFDQNPAASWKVYSKQCEAVFYEWCGAPPETIIKLKEEIAEMLTPQVTALKKKVERSQQALDKHVKQLEDTVKKVKPTGQMADSNDCVGCVCFTHCFEMCAGSLEYNVEKNRFEAKADDYMLTEFIGNENYREWKVKNPKKCSMQRMSELYPEYLDGDILIVPWKHCGKKGCPLETAEKRNALFKRFIEMRPELKTLVTTDANLYEKFPLEYLESKLQKMQEDKNKVAKEHAKLAATAAKVLTPAQNKGWFQKIKEKFWDPTWIYYLKKLGIFIGILAAIGAVIGIWSHCTGRSTCFSTTKCMSVAASSLGVVDRIERKEDYGVEKQLELVEQLKNALGEAHVSGDSKVSRAIASNARPAVRALINAGAKGEMASSTEAAIRAKIRRNSLWIAKSDSSSSTGCNVVGRCLGISDHIALCVGHYWEAWQQHTAKTGDQSALVITAISGRVDAIKIDMNELKFTPFEGSSIGIIELPRRINSFVDIRKWICPREAHSKLNMRGNIYELALDGAFAELDCYQVDFRADKNIGCDGDDRWESFDILQAYEYEGFSGPGRCGSVLVGHTFGQIIGIHVAGLAGTSTGFSEAICREMFEGIKGPGMSHIPGEGQMSKHFVDAQVINMGKVKSRFQHREKGKSRIIPSICQLSGEFEVFSEPAILSDKDPRIAEEPFSPMLKGCQHHGQPLKPFNSEDFALAVEDLENKILAQCQPQRKVGLLTRDEAIGGISDLEGYEHMEFSTSEGFPFVGLRPNGAINKRWLFEFDENNHYTKTCDLLNAVLDHKWQLRMENTIPATVFTDCLKDCTISKEKVLVPGKTRVFSMSPVDFTIQQRQVTLDFVVSYMRNRRKLEHMIGCNPDSYEWTWLSKDLLDIGDNIATGDYSKFGDTIPVEFIHAAFKIISNWYIFNGCFDSELHQQLKIMPYEIGNSLHLMFDHIYQVVCGQPSGNSLTVIINSIANSLYLRLAWLEIMRNTPFNSLRDFHKHVRMFSYGDDLIVSLSDTVKDQFNAVHWHKFFGDHNLKFTNSNKSELMIPYTSLAKADFLKRGFAPHPKRVFPQVVLAPLSDESIKDTPNWVWAESFGRSELGCQTFDDMCIQVCEDSVRNAFGRGPRFYGEWRAKIIDFWRRRGKFLTIDSWEQLDRKVYDFEMDLQPYFQKFRIRANP